MKKIIWMSFLLSISIVLVTGCKTDRSPKGDYPDKIAYVKSFDVKPVDVMKLSMILFSEDTVNFRFVDVRSPHRFAQGHLPHAINIPLKRLYEEKYVSLLNSAHHINIIYGEDAAQARTAAMMLRHYGYANNIPALGGYEYIREHIMENFGIYSIPYDDEVAQYDYAKVISETGGSSSGSVAGTTVAKPQIKVVKRKKKQEGGGGCE